MAFVIESAAFRNGEPILTKYTRDGQNLSPPLYWTGAPADTRSYVVIVEDPDAPSGTFRHWGMYNIPASETDFPKEHPAASPAQSCRLGTTSVMHIMTVPNRPKGMACIITISVSRLSLLTDWTCRPRARLRRFGRRRGLP